MLGTLGATARASTRPERQTATAADQARPPPRSTPTIGRPAVAGTGRPIIRFQSSTVISTVASSPLGTFRRYDRKRALSRESARALSRSSMSFRRKSAETAVSGLQRRISDHRSHCSGSPCSAVTCVEPVEPAAISSGHQPDVAGAIVPMNRSRSRFAVGNRVTPVPPLRSVRAR